MEKQEENADGIGLIHSVALGDDRDYRSLSKIKVLVDLAFKEVGDGKLNPLTAIRVLKEDLREIFVAY